MTRPRRGAARTGFAVALCLVVVAVTLGLRAWGGLMPAAVGGGVAAIVVAGLLGRSTARSANAAAQIAHAYERGDFAGLERFLLDPSAEGAMRALSTIVRAVHARVTALASERNQARAVLESMGEGVIAVDRREQILVMNPAAAVLLGLPVSSAAGQNVFEAVRHHEIQALVRGVLHEGKRATRDISVFQPKERLLRIHAVPCEAAAESVGPSAVLVIQDMTEYSRYEQLRKDFVANVSHELKSPLTSIRSLTETLLEGALEDPATNRRFVQLIDEDAARLTRLIDDLLALSQIESQAIPLKLTAVELRPMVESVLQSLRPGIEQRRLAVAIDLDPQLAVRADPDRLRQVLANLLDNAVKYNRDGGSLTIAAAREQSWMRVTISDTGIGIPPQDLSRVFERFYRVDKARSRELGGTGLGLSIVKHIVDAHGGSVSVESQLNRGSSVSFLLPA